MKLELNVALNKYVKDNRLHFEIQVIHIVYLTHVPREKEL